MHQFVKKNAPDKTVLLGAVGPLQFDLVQFRLESEYGAASRIETTAWKIIHWLDTNAIERGSLNLPHKTTLFRTVMTGVLSCSKLTGRAALP